MKRQIFRSLLYLSIVVVLFCVSPRSLFAQAVTGTVLGTVTDPGGAVVSGANVTITEVNTNFTRATVTNESGNYVIGNLDRGIYRIEIEHSGFKKSIRDKVDVLVNNDTRVDVQLEPGGVAEQVEVTSSVPLLQTDRADVGRQIETKQLQDMPLAFNRNFQSLLNLVPGASRAERFHSEFFNSQDSLGSRVNGQSRLANNVQIEGIDNNHRTGLLTVLIPPIEALSSVNVTTSNYEAELGRAGGAVTNVVLRSGTNQIHGSVFEFNRVSALAARPYFSSRKAPTVYNQFGFTIGGPIKKDRTFFFGDYQGIRDRRGDVTIASIPTLDFRNGDFRASPTIIYDPATGTPDGRGRQQIQCNGVLNVICPDRISPVARKILGFIPAPTRAGFTNNYELATVLVKNTESFDVKVDHKFSEDDSLFARYSFQRPKVFDPGLYGIYGGPRNDGFAGTGINRTQSGAVNYTHVFNPVFITEFRFGFTRYRNDALNQDTGLTTAKDIGIPGVNLDAFTSGLSYIEINGFSNPVVGFSPSLPWIRAETDVDLVSNWTRIFRNHTLKWGVDARLNKDDLLQTQTFSPRGRFTFREGPTALNAANSASGFANAFASFLLDMPNSYGRDLPGTFPTVRQKSLFTYVQDKWVVSQKLTLNLGLRHEIWFSPTPMFKGGFSNYNPDNNTLELAGIGNIPSNMGRDTRFKDFAPRVGLAYRFDEKTVVRAGYGISVDTSFPDDKYAFNFPIKQNNSFSAPNSFSAAGKMATGFAAPLIASTPANGIISPAPLNQAELFIPLNTKDGYIQSWNIAIERALPGNFIFDIAYVGNHNVGVLTDQNINAGLIPGAGAAGRPLNKKFGKTADVLEWVRTDTEYNALQVKLDHRFSNGLLLTTAYTFGKGINYSDDNGGLSIPAVLALNRGRTGYDRTHSFVQSYVYELPFGPGKRWLQSGFGRWVLGDWQLNGIFSAYSGLPLDFRISSTSLNEPGNANRPNLTGTFKVLGAIGPGSQWFDTSAGVFTAPAPATYGTMGRNLFSGPSYVNLDFSLFRKFRVTERVGGEFRVESFNFSNTPHFNPPGVTMGNPDFGQVTGTLGDPRRIEFGLKLTF